MAVQDKTVPEGLRPATPTASIIPHALLYIVQVVALTCPPSRSRNYVFAASIAGLSVYASLHPHFSNDPGIVQPFTIGWSYYMATLAKLLFSGSSGPEGKYWRIDRPQAEAMGYPSFGLKKLRWAVSLVINQRGIRWNRQVKNVPPAFRGTKAKFLALQAFEFVKCVLIADVLFQLSSRLNFTDQDGNVGNIRTHELTLRHSDWRWSFLKCLVFGAVPYFMLSMQYAQLAFVAVLLGITVPEDWPAPFGRLSDATDVRAFWGKYWHQQLRHMLTSYTDAFLDYFGIPRGTNWSSYSTLYLAFVFSGFFHSISQLQMPRPVEVSDGDITWGFFYFFLWQAAAITVEDVVKWIWKRVFGVPNSGIAKFLASTAGYLWVTWTIFTSLPLAGDCFLKMRMGEVSMLPFSLAAPYIGMISIPP